ncbi:MAG: putative porin [Flavobacteriaceae bacterium]|nr:putative porin [Flavobacteriaceae bacterium]
MKRFLQLILFILLIASNIYAQKKEEGKLNLYGDFRFRTELDRNSNKTNGTKRDNRDRLRYRLRLGFKYKLTNYIEFGGRIRSGNPLNQQSPHVTLGKEFRSGDFSIDKAYIKMSDKKGYWVWVGKNSMPLWKQNEFLWDDDVNPEGIALGKHFKLNKRANITPVFGYFIIGNSDKKFKDNSTLTIAQLKFDGDIGENNLTVSSGLISGNSIPNSPDKTSSYLLNYNILATNIQFNFKKTGLVLGVDYFENISDYNGNGNIDTIFRDQTTGYVTSLLYGIKKFQFGYYYAHIEKYAVIDYFAQDDWVRWGNSNYTRSSNFSGQEFRIKYKISKQFNTILRAYFVKGLKTTGTNLETGTRIRLDFNIKF